MCKSSCYMLMRHKSTIKPGIISLRASKSIFQPLPGLRHSVSLAPKVTNYNRRLSCLPTRSQFIPENSRRICSTRRNRSESSADNAAVEVKENPTSSNPEAEPEPEKTLSETPLLTRGEKFRDEFLSRIVPWEEIKDDSFDNFPYYISEHDKNSLKECVAARLKHEKSNRDAPGGRMASSSGRILLQTIPGAQLYRERLVRGLAKDLQVPLMVLDSSSLPPYDFKQVESWEEDKDFDDSLDITSSDDEYYSDHYSDSDDPNDEKTASAKSQLKQGDRVKYTGDDTTSTGANNRTISKGQRGEVHKVNGDKVAVVFYSSGLGNKDAVENAEKNPKPLVEWLDLKHVEHDKETESHDCQVAAEVLCEVLEAREPVIVYFPESFWWLPRSAEWDTRKEFRVKVKEMFNKLSGRIVLICGQNTWDVGSKELKESENLRESWKKLVDGLPAAGFYEKYEARRVFSNVLRIKLPKDEEILKTFRKQIEEDKPKVISQNNLTKMRSALKENGLLCTALKSVELDGLVLNKKKAEKIIGWARNHYLTSNESTSVTGDRMDVPQASLELAITRLKEQENEKKPSESGKKSPKDLASCGHERAFVSSVISPDDIGIKFDDVGALETVKNALDELVILPMKKPGLFSRGNLRRSCKGLLLFGPPGTGKTLIAKAVATEAGAHFINVTPSSITSLYYGEEEKLARALFSFARKLAPTVIFIDEIDSLLGARGGRTEHEATRSLRNEFMLSWDGLVSKENERVLVLGATNRPFDIDDAVIRRMPRRIYVGLPDLENRSKILKVHLANEELEPGFSLEQLAAATEGYSGSDLKNLCLAAAYKPVQDYLQQESKSKGGDGGDGAPALRPLTLDDFIQSKAQVAPSVAHSTTSLRKLQEWNEWFGEGGSRGLSYCF
ncbi:hypothetical protein CASFOL_038368 [Castilleja foliolosa]|uniref:AAA+ ATPase domain-containing protein n=1 Tax=Castilleja foliolosa TaxID=1961234 RepID=A0ABD3B784_9LAMI